MPTSQRGSFSAPRESSVCAGSRAAVLGEGPLLRDSVYRENDVVPGVVDRRFGALYTQSVATFRKESDKTPSKVWPLRGCLVGPVQQRECMVKARRIPIIMGLTAGKFKQKTLFGVPLWWEDDVWQQQQQAPAVTVLFFPEASQAQQWREVLIKHTDAKDGVVPDSGLASPSAAAAHQFVGGASGGHPAWRRVEPAESGPWAEQRFGYMDGSNGAHWSPLAAGTAVARDTFASSKPAPGSGPNGELPHGNSGGVSHSPYLTPVTSVMEGEDDGLQQGGGEDLPGPGRDWVRDSSSGNGDAALQSSRWATLKHHNGVAVYLEDERRFPGSTSGWLGGSFHGSGSAGGRPDGSGGAMMVSAVVRATPSETFKALMDVNPRRNVGNVFSCGSLLERGEDDRDVLLLRFTPGGVLGALACPRDLVVARTWRREDGDGTYIILYQSTDHPAAPRGAGWSAPIRGEVQAAGITVAPLMPRYYRHGHEDGESPECLVTMVMKVDPGGWLSTRGWVGRRMPNWVRLAWAEPFILSVITLRDRIEQERFVVQPFLLVDDEQQLQQQQAAEATAEARHLQQQLLEQQQQQLMQHESPRRRSAEDEASTRAMSRRGTGKSTTVQLINYSQPSFLKPRMFVDSAVAAAAAAKEQEAVSRNSSAGDGIGADVGSADTLPVPATGIRSLGSAAGIAPLVGAASGGAGSATGGGPASTVAAGIGHLSRMSGSSRAAGTLLHAHSGTCDPAAWTCPGNAGFRLRGPNYLKDRKKIPAPDPVFGLAAVDLVRTKAPLKHAARMLPSIRASTAPFTFVVNIIVPGPPYLSLIMSWAADYNPEALSRTVSGAGTSGGRTGGGGSATGMLLDASSPSSAHEDNGSEEHDCEEEEGPMNPVDMALARFLAGDDASRNNYFKLIPRIVNGSWIVKQSVGTTPVILGKKLRCYYFRGRAEPPAPKPKMPAAEADTAASSSRPPSCDAPVADSSTPPAAEPAAEVVAAPPSPAGRAGGSASAVRAEAPSSSSFPSSPRCYMEVDVDVASSSVASHVVGLVQGATRSLVVDLGVLLEGGKADELPEALLGTVRFNYVDLTQYKWLDTDNGRVYDQGKEPRHLHDT